MRYIDSPAAKREVYTDIDRNFNKELGGLSEANATFRRKNVHTIIAGPLPTG